MTNIRSTDSNEKSKQGSHLFQVFVSIFGNPGGQNALANIEEETDNSSENQKTDSSFETKSTHTYSNDSQNLSASSSARDGMNSACSSEESVVKIEDPIDEDAHYDTDLEIDDNRCSYRNLCHGKIYEETCKLLGIVPASYFIRHIQDEVIHMPHHGLGPAGAKAVAVPLMSNTNVLTLNLSDNWIEADGGRYIAEMMKENCYITDLYLADNKLGNEGALALFEMLQFNNSLELLDISGNEIKDDVAPLLAAAMLDNNTIKQLNLSHNNLGKLAGEVLGHAIGENETLELLDLSWNLLRGKAGAYIVDGIKVNSRLKVVNLAWNGLGNESAFAIAECLKNNNVLSEFDISNNRININGISVIAKGLDANEDLKILRIGCNPMESAGAMILLNAISNERSTLQILDLKDVLVEKEFKESHQQLVESRLELQILHAGILSNYVIKGPPKKPVTEAKQEDGVQEQNTEG